jgi:exo-beta-1,3-glucanase (GH17 family)
MRHQILALCLLATLSLNAACGSSDDTKSDEPFVRRAIPAPALSRKAICYSGYRAGQSPEEGTYPSEAQIAEDLALLVRGGYTFIRLFDASTHAERTLKVIRDKKLDIKAQLGVWISGAKAQFDTENKDQIERAATLATQYKDIVVAISVGNETLDSWSNVRTPVADLVGYIKDMRKRVPMPVTTDDSWLPFTLGTDGDTSYADVLKVAQASDFLSLHVYAFADAFYDSWDWKQDKVPEAMRAAAMMKEAVAYSKDAVQQVRDAMKEHKLDIPLTIGESGWKDRSSFVAKDPTGNKDAQPEDIEGFMADPLNQKVYFDFLEAWVYGKEKDANSPEAAFYFEAFDEPWKEGDDHWGLFDVNRKSKFVVWQQFPDLKPADAAEPKNAAYFKP